MVVTFSAGLRESARLHCTGVATDAHTGGGGADHLRVAATHIVDLANIPRMTVFNSQQLSVGFVAVLLNRIQCILLLRDVPGHVRQTA